MSENSAGVLVIVRLPAFHSAGFARGGGGSAATARMMVS
jgi:hypothetical protein